MQHVRAKYVEEIPEKSIIRADPRGYPLQGSSAVSGRADEDSSKADIRALTSVVGGMAVVAGAWSAREVLARNGNWHARYKLLPAEFRSLKGPAKSQGKAVRYPVKA